MKNYILILAVLLVAALGLNAQVSEEMRSMSQGNNNAFVINIPNTDDDDAERLWKKFMKAKKAKTKKVKRSSEWFSEGVEVAGLVVGEVNVYTSFENSGDDVRMMVWFDLGSDYLSSVSHPSEYTAGEQILYDFEIAMYKENVKKEIKEEENNLKKLESELKNAKKDEERYERDIEQAKDKIKKAEANIESSKVEQEEINDRILAQKRKVEMTKKKLEARDN